jgi:hypothetical protein
VLSSDEADGIYLGMVRMHPDLLREGNLTLTDVRRLIMRHGNRIEAGEAMFDVCGDALV